MSDVSINYKGNEIANMNASGTKTLTTQGKYCEDNITINYTKPTPVEVESKDVDFYDYDGTRLYSYTKQEFLALNEMPANPIHEGLISQGWNWSLSGAKTHLNTYGYLDIGQLYITNDGATRIYVDLDDEKSLSPTVMVAISGSMVIDWGDGLTSNVSGTSIYTNISTQHTYASTGNYIVRLIPQTSSTISIRGTSAGGSELFRNSGRTTMENIRYLSKIYKIELGSNIRINYYAFSNMLRLKSITMPSNQLTASLASLINNCVSLRHITLPNFNGTYTEFGNMGGGCNSLQSIALAENFNPALATFNTDYSLNRFPFAVNTTNLATFNNAKSLKEAFISSDSTGIEANAFRQCYSLTKIHIPSGITNIGANAFYECYSMRKYDFTNLSQVPTLANTNAFSGINQDCKIVVPDSLYATWITATNWSNYASYIVKESEYVG